MAANTVGSEVILIDNGSILDRSTPVASCSLN